MPPKRRLIEPSTWLNRLNSRSCCAGAMPMPVSTTENRTVSPGRPPGAPPSSSRSTITVTEPSGVNFTALFSRLSST
ncbi:hypothetical protein AU375_02547 [Methylobacterium radiotolerans]|nr:hypothetical protein AU375_02547 [Methylobacterium radiotolerans]